MYQIDTEAGTLLDTVMELVAIDGETVLAENDDDERATGRADSYIEWECEESGTYYVVVKGFGVNTGTFSVGIRAISEDPCDGGVHRARSHCRFVRPFIPFIPDSLMYSAPLFLK